MKKSIRVFAILAVAVLALGMFASCSKSSSSSSNTAATTTTTKAASEDNFKPMVLKLATSSQEAQQETNSDIKAICYLRDEIEKRTDGKIKIEIYWGGALASSNEDIINGLQTGGFEMNLNGHGVYGDYTKAFFPYSIPYLFTSLEAMYQYDDSESYNAIAEQFEKDLGIKLLSIYETGFRNMTSNKGFVKTPADMKGLKLRTMSDPYQIAAMKTLGAAVTPIAWGDLFTSLQQGLVDAQENPVVLINSARLYEVQKYLTFTQHNVSAGPLVLSLDAWNKMPEKYQKIFMEVVKESQVLQRQWCEENTEKILDIFRSKGMEIYTPTASEIKAFQDVVMTSWDVIRNDVGAEKFDKVVADVLAIEEKIDGAAK